MVHYNYMLNKNELLYTVSMFNQPITPLPRHEVHSKKIWHRTTHVWIINHDNQILCQQRSPLKDTSPGKWEAHFGGHILASEHQDHNALTEIYEELGLNINKKDLHFFQIHSSKSTRQFQYIYLLFWNGEREELQLEQEEITQIKWFTLEKLTQILVTKKDSQWVIHGYEKKLFDYFTAYGFRK